MIHDPGEYQCAPNIEQSHPSSPFERMRFSVCCGQCHYARDIECACKYKSKCFCFRYHPRHYSCQSCRIRCRSLRIACRLKKTVLSDKYCIENSEYGSLCKSEAQESYERSLPVRRSWSQVQ